MLSVLPRALRERTVVLNDAPASRGRYVLYWMHHALRVNENPALDVARLAAAELDLPLLVCQGLGGAHPYQNDRHHFFALQCARDVANDLAAYGIHYRFHLDARRHGSVASLMPDAALTVFEQMPVAPFPKWQASLSARAGSSVLRVDARCIVPMPLMTKRYDRAFAFRKAAIDLFDARVLSAYPSLDVGLPTGDEDLSVGALDVRPLDDGALLDLVASCPIDHSVAPVFETVGGSAAGYARWQAFRNGGLRSYHQTRNDAAIAPPAGVSRLSPYLHYGCVSPMRVAREAQQVGGAGAEKFLDELFVWRELAHNFCAHSPQLETLDALPAWASETLRAHANDPRPAIFSWDTLAHARTGEPLWDTAQRSLLRHGELHNNVRMTWAKQLLQWTSSPERALAMLLDLNHRYALDGSDPNSYGGLLWAMGQFDRPFTPDGPVTGTVRGRSIKAHAARLDIPSWRQRIDRPSGVRRRVAVIGAGIAGLAAARSLCDHGHQVAVFDKGRGVGGRMSTRRADGGNFDHGAQFFTARHDAFLRRVLAWCEDGLAARWPGELVRIAADGVKQIDPTTERFVFVPGMNALCKHLASELDTRLSTRVEKIASRDDGWQLDTSPERYDDVVVTIPLPQAAELLEASELTTKIALNTPSVTPCLAAMLVLPACTAPFDAAFVDDHALAWVAHDSSKPGRRVSNGLTHWVVHASEQYSLAHVDLGRDAIGERLAHALHELLPDLPAALSSTGHRWRYARVNGEALDPLGDGAVAVRPGLWLAGDGCTAKSRVESAWLSGMAAAARVMASANSSDR